jgi:uncharacterized repeat protein (TIGR04076 family)
MSGKEWIPGDMNYEVSVKVISQTGSCWGGLKVGEEWLVRGRGDSWKTPSMCMFAFTAIFPSLQMLMYGGSFPWEPDSRNPVVFQLTRMGEAPPAPSRTD